MSMLLTNSADLIKDELSSSRNYSAHLIVVSNIKIQPFWPLHCKSLPAASLSVSKYAYIVSIKGWLDKWFYIFKKLFLCAWWLENFIKMKNWVFPSLIVKLNCFHWVHKFLVLNNKTRIIFEIYWFHSAKYSHWSSQLHDHSMLLNPWFFIKADLVYQLIVHSLCHFKTLWKFREFD